MRLERSLRPLMRHLQRFALRYVSFVLLVYPAALRPGEACERGGTSADTLILCRACGHELAHGTDIHFVPSRLALSSRNDTLVGGRRVNVQLLENPHGHRFEVITFRRADVTQHWPADKHFSWFPGFSWTVATCPRCNTHLAQRLARHHHKKGLRGLGAHVLGFNHPSTPKRRLCVEPPNDSQILRELMGLSGF